ncbi:MAG TPA: dephospho-CoA kinase, partial [Thermoplasmatales archaeon]|nr:dephospho-CoA kinase [Thermoplasmatales archaeon]
MLKIGLTGLPGSGKTTVTSMFKLLGVEIISADAICHSLLSPCKTAYHEILN